MIDALIVLLVLSLIAVGGVPLAASLGKKGIELVFYSYVLSSAVFTYFVWLLSYFFGFSDTTIIVGFLGLMLLGALFKPKGIDFRGHTKRAYILPIFFLLFLLSQRYINANQGVDWQDLTIIGSIMNHRMIPPVNNWLPTTVTNYQYGYHLFVAMICTLSGVDKAVAMNIITPFFVALMLLGVYILASKLSYKPNAGVYAQVLSISGSLAGPLFLLYLLKNPFVSDESLWTLGKIPLFFNLPDRTIGHVEVVSNMLISGVNLPFPSTYFLSGTAFGFSFAFFILAVLLLMETPSWRAGIASGIALATLALIYPFTYVLLAVAILIYTLIRLYYKFGIPWWTILTLVFSGILALLRVLDSKAGTWLPYLDTYSFGVLTLFFGGVLLFFIIGVIYFHKKQQHTDERFMICVSVVIAAFILVASVFPIQQGIADRKYLVVAWLIMAAIGGVGVAELFKRYGRIVKLLGISLLCVGLISPAMMFSLNLMMQPTTAKTTISDFPAWQSNIQPGTFDSLKWIKDKYPAEYAAAQWVKENTSTNAVFLEAPIEKYKFSPILPILADRQVYVGWYGFLNQQGYDPSINVAAAHQGFMKPEPCTAGKCIYELPTVDYIWFGDTERKMYGYGEGEPISSELVDMWDLKIIYNKGGVVIYEVP